MRERRAAWSRRAFVAAVAGAASAAEIDRHRTFPSDSRKFPDPATEFEVIRLTDPAFTSRLPEHYNRALSRRGGFLIYSSDRTGSMQVFRLDLKSGESRQLTEAEALDPGSVNLMPDERGICFVDGPTLRYSPIGSPRSRDIYEVEEGWTRGPGVNVTVDGVSAVFAEQKGGASRLRLVGMAKGGAVTVTEAPFPIAHPQARPKRAQILYRQANESLWLVNLDGKSNRRLRTAPGAIGPAMWNADGKTILYLNYPEDKTRLHSIRELTPDENLDRNIAPTSQFVHFGANSDASVFVGASRNAASPHILILLRITRRELTVCEHRASDPSMVAPIFSPNSQRIYFHSDKHGKPAIYQIRVERFVEKTEDS
jgi:oligogalacturonide lyase